MLLKIRKRYWIEWIPLEMLHTYVVSNLQFCNDANKLYELVYFS